MTKQGRKTARRKARQAAAWSMYQRRKFRQLRPIIKDRFDYLSQTEKQKLVEVYEATR